MPGREIYIREGVVVVLKAIMQVAARIKVSREELARQAEKMIRDTRETTALLMKEACIPPTPED